MSLASSSLEWLHNPKKKKLTLWPKCFPQSVGKQISRDLQVQMVSINNYFVIVYNCNIMKSNKYVLCPIKVESSTVELTVCTPLVILSRLTWWDSTEVWRQTGNSQILESYEAWVWIHTYALFLITPINFLSD